ncbi:alpha/beta fold hydrolase [Luteimonas terrae]|uniref:Pimeloyl-ACP methyl ester carboxylesterase n=1 Tax=Luteimonas terrae TaxID=1530191 RepID=A0ABU1Y0T6_9GAMM|nr:alpha/beta hydrolase [Luteimonas terrae]MDR7194642.1 pimeloyl-ACP methyl ester carboxylesterase [Luteimonas terrae]
MTYTQAAVQPIADKHTIVDGHRIAYATFGEGEPVVLVHGTPSSSLIWRHVVPRLTAVGFKAHVFDLLGYGESERPWRKDVDTSISGQVRILEAMMDVWGLDTTHLVAHDIGGGVAQRFGVFHLPRLRTLTLIDSVSFDSYPSKRTQEQMSEGLDALVRAPEAKHRAHFETWLRSASADPERFANDALPAYLDYISGPVGQASYIQHQMWHYDPKHTMEIADRVAELGRIPVQLIWGREDTWQVLDWAHRLHKAIPGSELHVVENAGHFSLEDRPEAVSEHLIHFLQAQVRAPLNRG